MEQAQKEALAQLLKDILSGTAELGFASLPAIAAFAKHRKELGWRVAAITAWAEADPKAHEILIKALTTVRSKLPEDVRKALIIALDGIPK